jgi:hypothetical protein
MAVQWNLLDPNMAAKVGGSFQEGQRNALVMQQAGQEQQMNALKMQQAQQEMGNQNALNKAFQESGGDIGKAKTALMQAGQYKPAMELDKHIAERDKLAIEAQKAKIETGLKAFDYIDHSLAGVRNQNDLDIARQHISQNLGDEYISRIPEIYNPQDIQSVRMQAVPIKEQLEQRRKEAQDKLESEKFGYQQQHDVEQFGVTMRGQDLASQRAAEANRLKSEENAINASGIVGKQVRETELKLQDDYRTESKGFSETATAMKKVLGSIDNADKNAASALAAGTAFMKLLDPNSVVRETELGMALNSSGWFDRATNIANQLQSGKIMTKTQKDNLKKASQELFEEAKSAQLEVDAAYKKRAEAYGADPNRVIVNRGQNIKTPKDNSPPSDWTAEDEAEYKAKYGD